MTYLTNRAGEFSLYLIEDVTINFKVATDNFHSIRHLKCNNCILSPKLSEYNTISAFQLPTFLVCISKIESTSLNFRVFAEQKVSFKQLSSGPEIV